MFLNVSATIIPDYAGLTLICGRQHSPQLHFEEIAPSILRRIQKFPPSHSSYPHPSLIYAMRLTASFFLSSSSHPARVDRHAKWNSQEIQEMFLLRSRKSMHTAPRPENLFDSLLAMGLIARYFFWTMRLREGYDEGVGMSDVSK
jgi:hypothetical protein